MHLSLKLSQILCLFLNNSWEGNLNEMIRQRQRGGPNQGLQHIHGHALQPRELVRRVQNGHNRRDEAGLQGDYTPGVLGQDLKQILGQTDD